MSRMGKFIEVLTMKEAGRKFRAFLICMIAASGALLLTAIAPDITPLFAPYLTALGGFLVAYLGGNIAHRHVELRNGHDNKPEDMNGSTH